MFEHSAWFQRLMAQISAKPALGHLRFSVVGPAALPKMKWPRWRRLSISPTARQAS